ncbi:COMPASS-like H3K4 histone methylase component WDR5A-like [Homarus americanus]|uniref:COMPASS-like H3K4 histone methylase component WDR5A-like n=1 Tax=Homarus americanus TaxID=6706 RepID=A0A8J5JSG0_HOMAM|nr:COMPASS-like H3K4 histone methylase component WDR5A-like [Homarus americanus]
MNILVVKTGWDQNKQWSKKIVVSVVVITVNSSLVESYQKGVFLVTYSMSSGHLNMSQRPSSGVSEVGSGRGSSPPNLVLPQLPSQACSSSSTRTSPSRTSVHGTSPHGKRRISTSSSVASGTSLASLLVKLHQPASSSLSLEGKLKIRTTIWLHGGCRSQVRSGQVLHSGGGTILHATDSDGRLVTWRGRSVGVVQAEGGVDVRAAVVGGLDNQVVTFTRGQVTVRDANTLGPVATMDQGVGGHLLSRGSLWAVSGRGRELVGGGGGLTWWDARTGSVTRSISGVPVRGPALAWHPHSNRVVSGSWGGGADSVKVWEASTGRLTHLLHSDAVNTSVYSTVWAGKEVVAVGGADPNLLRLTTLDNTTVGVLRGVRNTVWALDALLGRGHQGTRLALASASTLYILDVLK